MAAGQQGFAVAIDVAALDACGAELAVLELDRGAVHARQLRVVLRMHAIGISSGTDLGTVPQAALFLGCSEHRAAQLLAEGLLLGELAGALEAMDCGLLTVEQAATVVQVLTPLPFTVRRQVWERLRARLILVAERGSVLPPARLSELLRTWVIAADAADATERRRKAEAGRTVDWRRRDDGLHDLFAFGFAGPDAQAALSRIRDRSAPVGPDDDRTADQRRFDACKDILLGRDPLPLGDPHDPTAPCACSAAPAGGGRAACGCLPGSPVPCGAELLVHLTVRSALGTSDEPAELVGHGPLEPDLLQALLLAGPRLRPVWTDEHGVVLAVGDQVVVPERGDPASVRQALLHLAGLPPPPLLHPRHAQDHPPEEGACEGGPAEARAPGAAPAEAGPASRSHPDGQPGKYRLPRRLLRLLDVRSPRCEWPGCGARAVRCDAEHDVAWPAGPTCACNLGPCCRGHHRVKQLGWTKTRHAAGVTWIRPHLDGGPSRSRSWLSPAQHPAPLPAVRPLPSLPDDDPFAELSPRQKEEELWWFAGCPDDPAGLELRATENHEPDGTDHLGEHLRVGDTRWTLDLDNPYDWLFASEVT